MNKFERRPADAGEAKIEYLDGDFRILRPGSYVRCGVTGDDWGIVALSLRIAVVAVLLTLPIAFALAWLLARRRFPGRVLLDALVHLPLVLPPVVTGWALLLLFGRMGPAGARSLLVVTCMPCRLKIGSAMASAAAMRMGRNSPSHPAITALTAIRSTVAAP